MRGHLLCLFAIATRFAVAQDMNATLFQYRSSAVLPVSPATVSLPSIALLHDRATISDKVLQSSSLAANFPFLKKNSHAAWGGIGGFFQSKSCSSDWLQTSVGGLSIAYKLNVSKDQSIDFGLQPAFSCTRTAIDKITTGNQWLASEFRFDANSAIGEDITTDRRSYIVINSGLRWSGIDVATGRVRVSASLVATNLNRPKNSLLSNTYSQPVNYLAILSGTIFSERHLELSTLLVVQKDNAIFSATGQLAANLCFSNDNPFDLLSPGTLGVNLGYRTAGVFGTALNFDQPYYSLGVAYDFPISSTAFFSKAFEVGLILKLKAKTKTKESPLPAKRVETRVFDFKNLSQEPPRKIDTVDKLENEIKEVDNVAAVRFELQKNFKFGFGDAILNDEAKAYLNNISQFLLRHPEYKLEIIGHTDNVGKQTVNEKLSSVRAAAVLNYLTEKGVDASRLSSKGRGDRDPIAPNDTEANRARNRRVQFIIYIDKK